MTKQKISKTNILFIASGIILGFTTNKLTAETLHHFRFETNSGIESDSASDSTLAAVRNMNQVTLPSGDRGTHFPTELSGIGTNQSAIESIGNAGFVAENTSTVDDAFTIELFAHFDSLDSSTQRAVLAAQASYPTSGAANFGWAFVAERSGGSNPSGATSQPRELEIYASDGNDTWLIPSRIFLEESTDYFLSATYDINSDVQFYVKDLFTNTAHAISVPNPMEELNPYPLFGVLWEQNWARMDGIVDEVRFSRGVLNVEDLLAPGMPESVVVLPRAAYRTDGTETRDYHAATAARIDSTEKLLLKFDIPNLGAAAADQLQSATLRVFVDRVVGDIDLAEISLFHSTSDDDYEILASDLTDASYTDTNIDIFQPGNTLDRYFEVDVTDWLLSDYTQDGVDPVTSFRLEPTEEFRISLLSRSREQPQLVLTFVPEPNASVLLILGVIAIMPARRNLQMRRENANRFRVFERDFCHSN